MTPLLFTANCGRIAADMRLVAARMLYDGRNTETARRHIQRCTRYHPPTQAVLLFTRDGGMHSSGWWKNPDYERCFHLSISFGAPDGRGWADLPQDHKRAAKWCEIFFGENTRLLWIEPPFSDVGKARDVYHYRLFCDEHWQPIKPRGEVYSRELTPAGWQSWSDLHGQDNGDENLGARNG